MTRTGTSPASRNLPTGTKQGMFVPPQSGWQIFLAPIKQKCTMSRTWLLNDSPGGFGGSQAALGAALPNRPGI